MSDQDYSTEMVHGPRALKWKTDSNLNYTGEANWRFNKRKRGRDTIADTIPHEFARKILAPKYNFNFISSISKKLSNSPSERNLVECIYAR